MFPENIISASSGDLGPKMEDTDGKRRNQQNEAEQGRKQDRKTGAGCLAHKRQNAFGAQDQKLPSFLMISYRVRRRKLPKATDLPRMLRIAGQILLFFHRPVFLRQNWAERGKTTRLLRIAGRHQQVFRAELVNTLAEKKRAMATTTKSCPEN